MKLFLHMLSLSIKKSYILLSPVHRYYMIQRAKDAQVVGIVVGTLGVGR